MIAVGVLGGPLLGALQDQKIDKSILAAKPAIHSSIVKAPTSFPLIQGVKEGFTTVGPYQAVDQTAIDKLPKEDKTAVEAVIGEAKQKTLANFAIFPILMALGFGSLLMYFVSRGGYKPVAIGAASH